MVNHSFYYSFICLATNKMRRGHQHHPRFVGQRKSTVSIDDVIAALKNEEFFEDKEPDSPCSMDSQGSPPRFFREKRSPSDNKHKNRKRHSGNFEAYHTGSPIANSPSNKRHSKTKTFYGSTEFIKNDSPARRSVNERLAICQGRSIENLSIGSFTGSKDDISNTEKLNHRKKSLSPLDRINSKNNIENPEIDKAKCRMLNLSPIDKVDQISQRKSNLDRINRQEKSKESTNGTPKKKSSRKKDDGCEDWSKMRCTSELSEVVAEKEKRKGKKKSDAYDLDTIFAEAMFRSDTLMRFNIIKNELHNIQKSQLKRAENDFSCFNKRIESQEKDLYDWEKELKSTQDSLSKTSESMERAKRAKEDAVNEIASYDECMMMLEKRLEEIQSENNS